MTALDNPLEKDNISEKLLSRWLLGSDALPNLEDFPTGWHSLLQPLPKDKQSVTALGLMGHYQALTERPYSKDNLQAFATLPPLSAPFISEYSPRLYHLTIKLLDESFPFMVVALLAQRGYAIPPKEYFAYIANKVNNQQYAPQANLLNYNDTVDYQGWQLFWETWRSRLGDNSFDCDYDDHIDADNWHDFMPAYRRQALMRLRNEDPTACRELIEQCFMQESAEERVKILTILFEKLSTDDREFLQSLLNDRSKKVVEVVKKLLMQVDDSYTLALSKDEDNEADLELLAQGFEVKKEKKQTIVQMVLYKTHKKRNKRRQLLLKYGLVALADRLEVSLNDLLSNWQFNNHHLEDNQVLLQSAKYLPDNYLADMATSLQKFIPTNMVMLISDLFAIWHRFTDEQQQQLLWTFINKGDDDLQFYHVLDLQTQLISDKKITFAKLKKSALWKNMLNEKQQHYLDDNCLALGMLLPQDLAKQALPYLQKKFKDEYMPHDRMYYSLRLNAELDNFKV